MSDALPVPEMVRQRAVSLGAEGEAWLSGLREVVESLVAEWGLVQGRTMAGGTGAFVAEVLTRDGREAVLKIAMPGEDPTGNELRTLLAAGGRGYAAVFGHDGPRRALLLERLGPQLHELGLPLDEQMAAICATLLETWAIPTDGEGFTTGAEKAAALAEFIETLWGELDRPCGPAARDTALRFAEIRGRAFDPDRAVLAHGDAHAWNTLLVPGGGPRRFKFVDPDGLFIEPAYDLAIPMREWADELLACDPVALGVARCRRLAALTGVDPVAIWQWGFIERVSTGLLCEKVGFDGGREMLTVADAWAAVRAF
jgi:streptomycin 6-kinase